MSVPKRLQAYEKPIAESRTARTRDETAVIRQFQVLRASGPRHAFLVRTSFNIPPVIPETPPPSAATKPVINANIHGDPM